MRRAPPPARKRCWRPAVGAPQVGAADRPESGPTMGGRDSRSRQFCARPAFAARDGLQVAYGPFVVRCRSRCHGLACGLPQTCSRSGAARRPAGPSAQPLATDCQRWLACQRWLVRLCAYMRSKPAHLFWGTGSRTKEI